MDEKYKRLYDHLYKQGQTEGLGLEDWYNTYSQASNYDSLYTKLTAPNADTLYKFTTSLNKEDFYTQYFGGGVKKKDQPEVAPSVSVADGAETSAASPSVSENILTDSGTSAPDVVDPLVPEVQQPMSAQVLTPPEPLTSLSSPILSVVAPKEKPYFKADSEWGKTLSAMGGVGDFIDDIGRAVGSGFRQGDVVGDAIKVMTLGSKASDEDIKNLISEVKAMDELGQSDEFQRFRSISSQGGVFNFLRAVAAEPQAISEVFVQSMSSMVNKASLATAIPILTGGTLSGGPAGALGSLPYAMAAAGGVLETALTFTQVIQEELGEKPFTEDNVRGLLSDPEFMKRARVKSATRGGIIGVVDAIGSKVGIRAGSEILKRRGTARELIGTGLVVEGVSGGGGEALATAAAGDPLTAEAIGLETIVGMQTAPINIAATYANPPKYKVSFDGKTQQVDRQFLFDFLDTATPEEIRDLDVEIKNDKTLEKEFARRLGRAEIEETIDPRANTEERRQMVDLEEERSRLSGLRDTRSRKARINAIDKAIDKIEEAIKNREGPIFVAKANFGGPGEGSTFFSARYEGQQTEAPEFSDPETTEAEPQKKEGFQQTPSGDFREARLNQRSTPKKIKTKQSLRNIRGRIKPQTQSEEIRRAPTARPSSVLTISRRQSLY